jgi:signal transduction histidine kinase
VAQEALTNVRKHAGMTSVQVELRRRNGELRLVVHDRGRGFEETALRENGDPSWQVGLVGMRERVELLGGRFALRSAPEKGTRVEVTLPITPTDRAGSGDG